MKSTQHNRPFAAQLLAFLVAPTWALVQLVWPPCAPASEATDRHTQVNLAQPELEERQPANFAFIEVNGTYVALDRDGALLRSSEDVLWPRSQRTHVLLYALTCGAGLFVSVGYGGIVMLSTDGVTWSGRSAGTPSSLHSIAYGHDLFVAVGNEGVIVTSADGMNWRSQHSPTEERLRSVVYARGMFVAVGYNGTILTSKDGVSWTLRNSGIEDRLQGVAYGGDMFVAVGWHGRVLTSKTGIHWAKGPQLNEDLQGVQYESGRFLTFGASGTRLFSADGNAWRIELERKPAPMQQNLSLSLAWSQGGEHAEEENENKTSHWHAR